MEELLKYVNEQIEILSKKKRYTIDEDGDDIDCYDGECIYDDGYVDGRLRAYCDISQRLTELLQSIK